jgi:hypothetical protein
MPKIAYRSWKPSARSLELVTLVNSIIADYQARGFSLTLRQLYYQAVSRDVIPNTQRDYKNLGEVINNARYAGLIDWNAIEDRTRNLSGHSSWSDPDALVGGISNYYETDPWPFQPCAFEVWVEKEALADVVAQACRPRRVPHFSCRGYVSAPELWGAAGRLRRKASIGMGRTRPVTVIHLGDHDPSGIDMTRDITDRLHEFGATSVQIKRIALNMDQIEQYDPPPNPAKTTDARFEDYSSRYGEESWELDALDPQVIVDLIQAQIEPLIDVDAWEACRNRDLEERALFKAIGDNWSGVKRFCDDHGWIDDARDDLAPIA